MRVGICALAAAVTFGLSVGVLPEHARAQGSEESGDKDKDGGKGKKGGPTVDPLTGKKLNDALELLRNEKYAEARNILSKLQSSRLSPYEVSRVEQIFASLEQGEGKYDASVGHLKKALASGGLNDQEALTVRFQVASLLMQQEKWKEGIAALKEWFAVAQNPNSQAYYLLAIAYYQLDDYNSALEPAQKAVDLSGEKPQENWLQLLASLRYQREEYRQAVPILRRLVTLAPAKKSYWLQLSQANSAINNDAEATQAMQLAYHAGLLNDERELRRLAELLRRAEIPHRAALILTKGIDEQKIKPDTKMYELLGDSWLQARDFAKAVGPLDRGAELAETGELFVREGEVEIQREQWAGAAKALSRGLEKGKLKSPGRAQLLLGIALYNQTKLKEARAAFERARADNDQREQARSWLKQVDYDEQNLRDKPGAD